SYRTYVVQNRSGAVTSALSFAARAANAVVSIPRYIGKFLWPANLAALYPHPGDWAPLLVVTAVLFVLVVTGVAWMQRRRRPWLLVGWLWFLGMLVPVSGLVQVGIQSMADRYSYFQSDRREIALVWSLWEAVGMAKWSSRATQ